ncbi:hypothetical protein SAMN02910291_00781 [Desulfovibrio desulfuricans]|uniref:Uncharacterized protein n=2 Tax=Desulfovibrio TaxID=872 RepID=A0AA94L1K9_DESDE|nr:hypothetical protein CNY67_02825 [Desulfovibrio sp. G11]SFW31352.1 hypothetical protein SAMN02910291_00781 [Desulfovibrio desulfuricans]SPD35964.1 Hypothetical protein DSVG11_1868 [Desulfovibrio sp. G11]
MPRIRGRRLPQGRFGSHWVKEAGNAGCRFFRLVWWEKKQPLCVRKTKTPEGGTQRNMYALNETAR